jgi:hypothetical protein
MELSSPEIGQAHSKYFFTQLKKKKTRTTSKMKTLRLKVLNKQIQIYLIQNHKIKV